MYFINEINSHNSNNKYIYLDCIDANLQLNNFQWYMTINFYFIMNCSLPNNLLTSSIQFTFGELENITINKSNNEIPNFVEQKNLCQVYTTKIAIDASEIYKQQLNDYCINFNFSFNYDSEVINNTLKGIPQTILDSFTNELTSCTSAISFNFSNYIIFDDINGWWDNANNFYLNSKNQNITKQEPVYYCQNNMTSNLASPLTKLLHIECDNQIAILGTKITFYYSIENDEIKKYEFNDEHHYFCQNKCDVNFIEKTSFENKEVVLNKNGIQGFYIPFNANGYYEVDLLISQNNNETWVKFKNDFNFTNNKTKSNITIKQIFIKDISHGFKKVEM